MKSYSNNLFMAMRLCTALLCPVFITASAGAQTPNGTGVGSQRSGGEHLSASRSQLMSGASSLKLAGGPNLQVLGGGTIGRLPKWTGFTGSNSFVGDSSMFEDKFGKVGIGIDTPTSRLTVVGMIETTLGGLKFPDGTVQTTAGLVSLFHDDTLTGNGTSGAPLGVAVPLNLAGNGNDDFVMTVSVASVANGLSSGNGILVQGASSSSLSGRIAVLARGGAGSGAGNIGGAGIKATGGLGLNGAIDGPAGEFEGDLKVSGDVKLGTNGQFFAAAGEENLRIVRGTVDLDGTRLEGSGFTSSFELSPVPRYTIIFDTPFAAPPAVTCTCHFIDGFSVVIIETNGINAAAARMRAFLRADGDDARCRFQFIAVGPR